MLWHHDLFFETLQFFHHSAEIFHNRSWTLCCFQKLVCFRSYYFNVSGWDFQFHLTANTKKLWKAFWYSFDFQVSFSENTQCPFIKCSQFLLRRLSSLHVSQQILGLACTTLVLSLSSRLVQSLKLQVSEKSAISVLTPHSDRWVLSHRHELFNVLCDLVSRFVSVNCFAVSSF